MGSVSTQSQACSQRERVSALVDGEAPEGLSLKQILAGLGDAERATWAHYHVIGDALRSDELAFEPAESGAFMARLSASLAAEPHLLAPAAAPVARRLLALRRRAVPAFAVAAAAATLTWIVVPQMQGVGAPGGVQVASVSPAQQGALQRVTAAQPSAQPALQDANIIRDASLDQYLEAHQQFAQQPVVTGSMPVIRTAVTTQGQ
ncbi:MULTISPECIES: sigma-E factor negative regulatory protein [Burkholderia]|uniref:Anti-sigma factor n=1 Tax=Burkholderia mayonis TaxID=1385591 RepID=A0A1B4FCL8_9BURK|nr:MULTISPECIES: sigma-E factor negative regulatory protein [Burkholderia]AOJ01352.1 anti-sigma factor [Burkholderia mayonis]KVE45425.1 anti-sigma factor [Burkholderia sp. BDU5]KVE46746.1 anti-sigma factor [Burkholderia mayonis]